MEEIKVGDKYKFKVFGGLHNCKVEKFLKNAAGEDCLTCTYWLGLLKARKTMTVEVFKKNAFKR